MACGPIDLLYGPIWSYIALYMVLYSTLWTLSTPLYTYNLAGTTTGTWAASLSFVDMPSGGSPICKMSFVVLKGSSCQALRSKP